MSAPTVSTSAGPSPPRAVPSVPARRPAPLSQPALPAKVDLPATLPPRPLLSGVTRLAAIFAAVGLAFALAMFGFVFLAGMLEVFDSDAALPLLFGALLGGLCCTYVPLILFFIALVSDSMRSAAGQATSLSGGSYSAGAYAVSGTSSVGGGSAASDVKPLGDPLMGARRFLFWTLLFTIPLWPMMGPLILMWLILPNRRTNAFYLRSFRNDPETWPRRKAAQRALGAEFRLSGIRDPRRRRSLLDWLGWGFFVLRYATPRYMNLEAGDDWKRRLWRSLADARCALIDVTDLTPFVHEEVELSQACLGLERLLFVCDASKDEAEWRSSIAKELLGDERRADEIHVAIWSDENARSLRGYHDAVRAFAEGLPPGTAGLRESAYGLTATAVGPGGPAAPIHTGWSFVAKAMVTAPLWLLLGILLVPLGFALGLHPDTVSSLGSYVFLGVFGPVFAWMFGAFLIDAALPIQRIKAVVGLLTLPLPLAVILPANAQIHAAADRATCSNNLRQIGLALMMHRDVHGSFPRAYTTDQQGKPLHSWRVQLLPFLEEMALYDSVDHQAPWDAPQNAALRDRMPKVFRCPSQGEEETTSPYVLVVDQGLFYERPDSWGPSQVLILESADAERNWMDPTPGDSKLFGSGSGASLRSGHSGGTFAILDTGEAVFLSDDDMERLIPMATAAGDAPKAPPAPMELDSWGPGMEAGPMGGTEVDPASEYADPATSEYALPPPGF